MSFLYWIIFGLVVGSLANFITPGSKGGIVGSIILGVIGAVVGGYLGDILFGVGVTGFNLMSLVVATAGAVLVIAIARIIGRG